MARMSIPICSRQRTVIYIAQRREAENSIKAKYSGSRQTVKCLSSILSPEEAMDGFRNPARCKRKMERYTESLCSADRATRARCIGWILGYRRSHQAWPGPRFNLRTSQTE